MQTRFLTTLTILACMLLSACSTVMEGVVIKKRFRIEMPEVYDLYEFSFRCEPSVYWVEVEGKDKKGREKIRDVILFRHDWDALRVGDHWSKAGGFTPGDK